MCNFVNFLIDSSGMLSDVNFTDPKEASDFLDKIQEKVICIELVCIVIRA